MPAAASRRRAASVTESAGARAPSTAASGDRGPAVAGQLFLIPAPLDFGCTEQAPLQDLMPLQSLQVASRLQHWVCESAKTARAYLKRVDALVPLAHSIQSLQVQELPRSVHKKGDHHGNFDARPLLAPALAGHDIGLISEAGMPAIADPGASVVRAAHHLGLRVVPLVGPASLVLALAASGLNGQDFAFVGYLPQDASQRAQRVRELERLVLKTGQTQLFIETPYRNCALLLTLLQTLAPTTRLAVSSALTMAQSQSRSATTENWRKRGWSLENSQPAVFAIGR